MTVLEKTIIVSSGTAKFMSKNVNASNINLPSVILEIIMTDISHRRAYEYFIPAYTKYLKDTVMELKLTSTKLPPSTLPSKIRL